MHGDALEHRFLILGCGSIGKRHLGNLISMGIQDVLAFDAREDRCADVTREFGVQAVADLSDALAERPSVAVICTPTSDHRDSALAMARHGCHLFIEKPLAHSSDGLDELIREVARRDLRTLVACNLRFHPGLQVVKRLLEVHAFGHVVSARARFGQYLPDWHPWEDYRQGYSARRELGGGVLLDRIHEIDYLVWLLGMPRGVFALIGKLSSLEIDTEDTVDLLLHYPRGPHAAVHLDYVRRVYDCGLEIVGDRGMVEWNFQEHRVTWRLFPEGAREEQVWPDYSVNDMYLAEMRHFLAVLDGSKTSACPVAMGRDVLEVALAARRSAASGKVVLL